jgi:hypothetical protein
MFSKQLGVPAGLRLRPGAAVLGVVGVVFMLLAACGELPIPFKVRDSQQPVGTATRVVQATEPDSVISNIRLCIGFALPDQYMEQLTPDFTFVPDPVDVSILEQNYPGIFDNWDLGVETRVSRYMLSDLSVDSIRTIGVLETTDSTSSQQVRYKMGFVLPSFPGNYRGKAILYMRKLSDNLWYLNRWEDFRPTEAELDSCSCAGSWGFLRGHIRATIGG